MALDAIRAELRKLAGQYADGLAELVLADWHEESEASARLWMLRGELQDALAYSDQALRSYHEGIQVPTQLLGQLEAVHQRRGLLYYRRRESQASWREIDRAESELDVLRGLVREEEGAYSFFVDVRDPISPAQHCRRDRRNRATDCLARATNPCSHARRLYAHPGCHHRCWPGRVDARTVTPPTGN